MNDCSRVKWSNKELGYVKRWYGTRTAVQIAETLGRRINQVYAAANRLGLSVSKPGIGQKVQPRIRELHRQGYSDSEIAADVGCSRRWVSELRHKMRLSSNAYNARYRARVAAKTREQCRKAGVRNLAALRVRRHAETAKAAGWPKDLRLRHVQILDLLYDHGPKTRREIADALDMPWKGSRNSLVSNDPEGSYLAHLMARGLVVCLPRKIQQGGPGKNVSLYMVPLYVHRDEKTRKENQCKNETEKASSSRRSRANHSRTRSAG